MERGKFKLRNYFLALRESKISAIVIFKNVFKFIFSIEALEGFDPDKLVFLQGFASIFQPAVFPLKVT